MKFFYWSTLRTFENFRIVKSMYIWLFIVPITAKMFAKIEGVTELIVFEQKFIIDFTLPFSWFAFYLSALCFVLGNLVVLVRCPLIHKETTNLSNFLADRKNLNHLIDYAEEVDLEPIEKEGLIIEIKKENEMSKVNGGALLKEENFYWKIYEYTNPVRKKSRIVAAIFYLLGAVLILKVLIDNFKSVLLSI